MHVAAIDIGSPEKGRLGWAVRGPKVERCGMDIDDCIATLATILKEGPLALGFEAPMFVPARSVAKELTRARAGEGNRAFSAGAGAGSLVTGLVIVPYVMAGLKARLPAGFGAATMDWRTPPSKPGDLLLFEAFVTKQNKTADTRHVEDALAAIDAFERGARGATPVVSAICESTCMSLLGAALLHSGWTTDLGVLAQPCLVVVGGAPVLEPIAR